MRGLKSGQWGETAGPQHVTLCLWRHYSLLFSGTGSWSVSSAQPPWRVVVGGTVRFVCPSQRKWFVFWDWQLVFVLESEATMRESRAKPLTVMDEVKQSWPPSLGRFPHSCLSWQLTTATHSTSTQRYNHVLLLLALKKLSNQFLVIVSWSQLRKTLN